MVSLAGARGEAVLALLAFAGPLPVNASQKVALPNGEVLNFGAKSGHKHKQLDWPINGRPVTEKDLADKRICWNDGRTWIYGAGGQFTNEFGHHMTSLLTEPGW